MTDSKLRDLQRKAASGDVEAEAKLLLERVRAGDLTEEKLRLAAYLGHEPARIVCKKPREWACGPDCGSLSNEAVTVSAHDIGCELYVDHWYSGLADWGYGVFLRARLSLLPAWSDRCRYCSGKYATDFDDLPREDRPCNCGSRIQAATRAEELLVEGHMGEDQILEKTTLLAGFPDEEEKRAAIQAELLPWALGHSDPVRDRVEARKVEGGE